MRQLQARLERGRATVFADAVQRLRKNAQEGSTLARRRALKPFLQKIEAGKERGTLYYTFPLYALASVKDPEIVGSGLGNLVYLESTPGGVQNKGAHLGAGVRLRMLRRCQ